MPTKKKDRMLMASRSPMPTDFGLPIDPELFIAAFHQSLRSESRRIRSALMTAVAFSTVFLLIFIIITMDMAGADAEKIFVAIFSVSALLLTFTLIPLIFFMTDTDKVGSEDTELKRRYDEYKRARYKYKKQNNQEKYSGVEYEVTQGLRPYISSGEETILNWAIHFYRLESNTNKLVAANMIGTPMLNDLINIREEELIFELNNFPYELGQIARVLEKAGNLAAEHDIEGAESIQTMGVSFYVASQKIGKDLSLEDDEADSDEG